MTQLLNFARFIPVVLCTLFSSSLTWQMASSKLFSLLHHSPASSCLPFFSTARHFHLLPDPNSLSPPPHPLLHSQTPFFPSRKSSASLGLFKSRAFSSCSLDDVEFGRLNADWDAQLPIESEIINAGSGGVIDVLPDVTVDDSAFPMCGVISILDGYHDLAGLPWWMFISFRVNYIFLVWIYTPISNTPILELVTTHRHRLYVVFQFAFWPNFGIKENVFRHMWWARNT